jgi:hypothetical protein
VPVVTIVFIRASEQVTSLNFQHVLQLLQRHPLGFRKKQKNDNELQQHHRRENANGYAPEYSDESAAKNIFIDEQGVPLLLRQRREGF